MFIATGDYVVEVLDRNKMPIPGAIYMSACLAEANSRAGAIAQVHGSTRWRIMRCISNSDDKERWEAGGDVATPC